MVSERAMPILDAGQCPERYSTVHAYHSVRWATDGARHLFSPAWSVSYCTSTSWAAPCSPPSSCQADADGRWYMPLTVRNSPTTVCRLWFPYLFLFACCPIPKLADLLAYTTSLPYHDNASLLIILSRLHVFFVAKRRGDRKQDTNCQSVFIWVSMRHQTMASLMQSTI